jgi:hypothetical protein
MPMKPSVHQDGRHREIRRHDADVAVWFLASRTAVRDLRTRDNAVCLVTAEW